MSNLYFNRDLEITDAKKLNNNYNNNKNKMKWNMKKQN